MLLSVFILSSFSLPCTQVTVVDLIDQCSADLEATDRKHIVEEALSAICAAGTILDSVLVRNKYETAPLDFCCI